MTARAMTRQVEQDALWSDAALGDALQASAAGGRLSDEDIRKMRAKRRRRTVSAATLALVGVIGAGGWQQWGRQTPAAPDVQHFATQPGEGRIIELADGSHLQMSGATRLDVTLGDDRREARLSAGEAYFDIRHDPARPFTVHAGATDVRVLGTAFDVDLIHDQVGLDVYRGAVRFSAVQAGESVTVRAGYRARYRHGHTEAPIRFDATQPNWRSGWLDADGMKLGELVEVLNRQGGEPIAPPPAALAGIGVSGRFRLDDSEQLLGAIGSVDGFAVRHQAGSLQITPAP